MKEANRILVLCLLVVLGSMTTGCSAGARSAGSRSADPSHSIAASRHIYLAQATCWNTMSCCIQRFPTTAAQSCGASASEIAEVLNGAKVLYEATQLQEAKLKEETREQEDAKAAEAAEAEGAAAPEPPDCQGENHHVISRPIAKRLAQHATLGGLYKPRDERFVAKAKDKDAHCGYQKWHREVDLEVMKWLRDFPNATQKQFETFLREIYSRPEMLKRFPNGF